MVDGSDDFYMMINPYFPTREMLEKISANLLHLIRYYPSDQQTIARKVQALEGVSRPLLVANGSCEAISIFLQRHISKALVTVPNFNEWEACEHVPISYDASTAEFIEAIDKEKVDAVCICNPNNPTGYYREDIEEIARHFPEIRFAIDVSFHAFVGEEIPRLPEGRNIVLIKSLGKDYGLCGVRLGYLATVDADLLAAIRPQIPIWNVNSIAEYLVDLCIEHRADYEESRKRTIRGTKEMAELLATFDFLEVFPTRANFVLVRSQKPLRFKVKCCDNKTTLDASYYRVAYNTDLALLSRLMNDSQGGDTARC